MRSFFIFLLFFLLFLKSCSKAPNEKIAPTTSAPYPQDSIGVQDTTGAIGNSAENGDAYGENLPKATDHADDAESPTKTSPDLSGGNTMRDSVHASIKKVTPLIIHKKTEIITPDFSKTAETDSQAAESPPPPPPPPVSDEGVTTTPTELKPQNAVLGFSYFPQIPQNETRDLRVFVKVQGDEKNVAKKLKDIEKEDMEFTKTDDSSVVCIIKNIEAFKKLSIKPIYDVEDFRVTRVDEDVQGLLDTDPNEQVLDFKNGNYWHWKVRAIAKEPHLGNITLRIKAETPEGVKIQLAERQINIKIGIDAPKLTFGQKVYQLADEHFKEILSLIIIPLALYLFNLLRKKFIAKRPEQNEQNKS